ncbi:Leucyl aminopeptidase PepA [[Mycoplasma] cavipharyngis]|uniref:leucyl aminopeptidase n=1 Tax=[Mycoplasma] cavipharyngis TaxID=92757 RepID=UPI003703E9A2
MAKNKKNDSVKKITLVAQTATTKDQDEQQHLQLKDLDENTKVLYLDANQVTPVDLYHCLLKFLLKTKKTIEIDLATFALILEQKLSSTELTTAICAAIAYANNKIPYSLKTKKTEQLVHVIKNGSKLKKEIAEAEVLASAQTLARTWQDMPNNVLYPSTFVEEIKKSCQDLPIKVNVLTHKQLLEKKMGLITAVGQGSEDGARIVTLEYQTDSQAPLLALVGKGVCFDTGGYSLKTGGHLRGMKFDMSGAAAVVAAIIALAKNKVNTNVIGVVGLVENLISAKAYRVDDVLTSYQGTTVEIDNTDAEGRLVLADCLTYAYQDLKADQLLSIATLTGAVIYALGSTYAGAWTKSDQDWEILNHAAYAAGESVWRLPFHNDYLSLLKTSHIADIKNSTNSPKAGSSRAACFLKEFSSDKPYFHLDIAGMDSTTEGSGSGPLVRTLYKLAANLKNK